jgi:hypothetical protein
MLKFRSLRLKVNGQFKIKYNLIRKFNNMPYTILILSFQKHIITVIIFWQATYETLIICSSITLIHDHVAILVTKDFLCTKHFLIDKAVKLSIFLRPARN